MTFTEKELCEVFGPASKGNTLLERAATSSRIFVRSQLQLALDSERATGHRLTASEALRAFGWLILRRVTQEGSYPLVTAHNEPAATLAARRNTLGLNQDQVARRSGLHVSVVRNAETVGAVSKIRDLEAIAQTLALNGRRLGHVTGADGDQPLGVRLREVYQAKDACRFSAQEVLALAEAAWVIAEQDALAATDEEHPRTAKRFSPCRDYRYRAYDRGFELAEKTRQILGLSPDEPIRSIRALAEEQLGIPVVQQVLASKFAGATISNGESRGIVVNELGMNENVWVRRMTLAHELGHLLWDPNENLNKVKVDDYDSMENNTYRKADVVEIRANAFAVSFLAPPVGVRQIMSGAINPVEGIATVMTTYGISATAAKRHVRNVTQIDANPPAHNLPSASRDWLGGENLAIDVFRPEKTPLSRRGRFAWLVVHAFKKKFLSLDTACLYLKCSASEFSEHSEYIYEALRPT